MDERRNEEPGKKLDILDQWLKQTLNIGKTERAEHPSSQDKKGSFGFKPNFPAKAPQNFPKTQPNQPANSKPPFQGAPPNTPAKPLGNNPAGVIKTNNQPPFRF